jgi:hypothetical protein
MKDQPPSLRFVQAWLWPGIALALAALLSACIPRTSITITAILVRPTVVPVRPLPVTAAPLVPTAAGCLNEQSAQLLGQEALSQLGVFCVEVVPGRIVTVEQAAAVGAIQQLFADPALQPALQGIGSMPNAPNGQLPALIFDDAARRYWVELEAGQVVEVDVLARQPDWSANPLPEAELRARAEQFIHHATPGFADIANRLAYQSGSKDGVLYFYRWEDRNARGWTNLPPLAQVGITVSGKVVAYLNTLFLTNPGSGGPAPWTPSPVPTRSPSRRALVMADQAAVLRSGPSTDYASVGQLTAGQWYAVKGQSGAWWLVAVGDGRGFVAKAVVVFKGDERLVPVVDVPPTPPAP